MNSSQVRAIKIAKKQGLYLANFFPQIAEEFRNGMSYSLLARKYETNVNSIYYTLNLLIPKSNERKYFTKIHRLTNDSRVWEDFEIKFVETLKNKDYTANQISKLMNFCIGSKRSLWAIRKKFQTPRSQKAF